MTTTEQPGLIEYVKSLVKEFLPHKISSSVYLLWGGSVAIDLDPEDVTFEVLEKLSVALGTKNINLRQGHISRGCETCGDATSEVKVIIEDITITERDS